MSSPPKKSDTDTSFASLESPAYDPKAAAAREREKKRQKTDFGSLKKQLGPAGRRRDQKTATDVLVDACIPLLIFLLVLAPVYFLLNVRFIYSAREHGSLRAVAFLLIMGVVALNRLIARDNTGESPIYFMVLAMVTILYTMVTTTAYEVGSIAGRFMSGMGVPLFFNLSVMGFVWWTSNRLMHECCADENRTAGDIGILTGTLRDLRRGIARSPIAKAQRKPEEYLLPSIEIEAYDPNDWRDTKAKDAVPAKPTVRLGRRHPGISIFYFTVPVMAVFALGLPVLMRGGPPFVLAGHVYVGIYTLCALMLLLLTSLGGLREYFRARKVSLPSGIGLFWVGLGTFMVLVVALGALQLPMPSMPRPAYVEEHEMDPWDANNVGQTFKLTDYAATAGDQLQQAKVVQHVGQAVLAVGILFGLYALARGLSFVAATIGSRRDLYPAWVIKIFNWLERILDRIVSLPESARSLRQGRPSAANALSAQFRNPMAGEGSEAKQEDVRRYLAHSFDALCALSEDMGRARRRDETPYEFLRHLPREMTPIKKEAGEVIEWYVRSAYSTIPPDPQILDRLRKFWFEYDRVRRRYLR